LVSKPHGGRLVNRVVTGKRREHLLEEARELQKIELSPELASDVMNIAYGVYSPLEGFLLREDYIHVLYDMRLSNDIPWTIPIVLDVKPYEIAGLRECDDVTLVYHGIPLALMRIEEIYRWDKGEYVKQVYGTNDINHPGVAKTLKMGDLLVGGRIDLLNDIPEPYEKYRLWPIETRILFRERGWKTIAGFQTRNVPYRGYEYT